MFMFMEGLPRSGKSYETCVFYILKALTEGRPVDAYVEGLNFEQFSELSGRSLDEINELLVHIPREDVKNIPQIARKNALIVIDELQNFWQKGRQTLSDDITQFITEHGHNGQDIIGMGQDLNDVHNLWRNRCARKFVFQKQDAVGRPNHYSWIAYAARRTDKSLKFEKINSGTKKYEEKYFGLYKSHNEGVSNFENFKDDRTNIFKSKTFTFYLPLFFIGFVYGIYYLVSMFTSDPEPVTPVVSIQTEQVEKVKLNVPVEKPVLETEVHTQVKPSMVPDIQPNNSAPSDYIQRMADKYRLRLGGVVKNPKGEVSVYIQVFDSTYHLQEYFTSKEIKALGWSINQTDYGISLIKDDKQIVVRSWPLDPYGKTSRSNLANL